jgi:predicted nucleic-acid-binding Zn-ribbon protein
MLIHFAINEMSEIMKCWQQEYEEGQCHFTGHGIEEEVLTVTL